MGAGLAVTVVTIIFVFFIGCLIWTIWREKNPQGSGETKEVLRGLENGMNKFTKLIRQITEIFNIIAVVAMVAMLLLVCANVVMRYIFKNPIPGTYELTQSLMICLTPCIAVNIMAKQCVWVDVVTSKFKRRGQLIMDIATLPVSVAIIGVMCWQGFNMILKSIDKGTYSSIMSFRLMEWPFRAVYFIAMLMATLAALAFMIERFQSYKNGGMPTDENEVDRAIEQVGDLSVPAAAEEIEGGEAL